MSSGSSADPLRNDVAPPPTVVVDNNVGKGAVARLFEEVDGTFPTLVMVCIGLRNNKGTPFFNSDDHPWQSL